MLLELQKWKFQRTAGPAGIPARSSSNPMPSQVWAFWRYVWANPQSGKHEIQVRATDANGEVRYFRSGEWPDSTTGYHSVTVNVA